MDVDTGKNKSFRVGKKGAVETAKKRETELKNSKLAARPTFSPAPHPIHRFEDSDSSSAVAAQRPRLIDGAFHIMNRQFDHDSNMIIERAQEAGVDAMVVVCNDFGLCFFTPFPTA